MKNIETEPTLSEIPEGAKPLQDALADFKEIEDNPEFRLQKDETPMDYFEKRAKEPEITLVIPLPSEENLADLASELRQAIFSYLKGYTSIAFAHLDGKQRDIAEADMKYGLGEIIENIRHSKDTTKLHNLYIRVKKVGDIIFSIKLINPTPENPRDFAAKHGVEESWHGTGMIARIKSDPKSQIKMMDQYSSILDGNQNVGCESNVILGPKDKVSEEEIRSNI